ncbi:MAG: translation elongation factor Ts [Candidatus Beckwithbacteria bacterium]
MNITAKQIKFLRNQTGAGMMEVKQALEEAKGNESKAKQILKNKGLKKAAKRADKEANEGQVFGYIHNGGRVASLVKILCETDFVARSDNFVQLGKEVAMQIASMEPKDVKELLKQTYIRDSQQTVADLVMAVSAKVKEKIEIKEIARISL